MSACFPYVHSPGEVDWDLLKSDASWYQEMAGVPQDTEWHGEGNVQVHTRMVVEALCSLHAFSDLSEPQRETVLIAALLHDVEKRSCTREEEQQNRVRIVSPHHARKGESTVRSLLYQKYPLPPAQREEIAKLVRFHGLPLWALSKPDPQRSVISASLQVNTHLLAMLAEADVRGRICPDREDLLLKVEIFRELCRESECYGQPRAFPSDHARMYYLTHPQALPEYDPYEKPGFEVTLLSALPGTGKDTWARKHNADLPVLSLDDLRREQGVDPRDKKGSGRIIQQAKEQAKVWLRAQQPFCFNATNITVDMRRKWIALFLDYHAAVRVVSLEVPYSQLMKQNRARRHALPDDAVEDLIRKWEPPTLLEAHILDEVFEN